MKPITITQTAIIIPFETAIALCRAGRIDPALLGYCLPVAIAERECPEVLRDADEIGRIAEILGEKTDETQ